MAHFYGTLQGQRGEASRLGSKDSGIAVTAASWAGAITVHLYREGDVDMARVSMRPWHGSGVSHELYVGPVGEYLPGFQPPEREMPATRARARARVAPVVEEAPIEGTADALVPASLEVEDPARWAEYNRRWNAVLGGEQ
jgi:hypothetical protein